MACIHTDFTVEGNGWYSKVSVPGHICMLNFLQDEFFNKFWEQALKAFMLTDFFWEKYMITLVLLSTLSFKAEFSIEVGL